MTEQLDTPDTVIPPPRLTFDGPKGPLFKALAEARKHFKDLSAVGKMGFEDKRGNKRVHEYAPLDVVIEALEPGLQACGIAVIQPFDGDMMHTIIAVGDSSMTISSVIPNWNSSQDLGAILTYFRRYQLKGIFCVADTEDDDASSAPGGAGVPMGRKQPSAPKAQGPAIPEELRKEVTGAAKANELAQTEFYALVKKQTGKDWADCDAIDAAQVLKVLRGAS